MVTTKINRKKPNCFLLQNKRGDVSGGFAFSCHALRGIALSASQSILRARPSASSLARRYLTYCSAWAVSSDSHLSFGSRLSSELPRASQCLKAGSTKTGKSRADAASGSPRPLSGRVRSAAEEQSCAANSKKQLSNVFLPFLQMQGTEKPGLAFPREGRTYLRAVGLPCRASAQQRWCSSSEVKAGPFAEETHDSAGKDFNWCHTEGKQILQMQRQELQAFI